MTGGRRHFRWGILGTGYVSRKFALGLKATDEMSVSAVCSRTQESARSFADNLGIEHRFTSYEEMLRADVIHSDGAGVVWGSALIGDALPERVTSITLLWRLAERWNDGSRSLYFLGGPPGMAEAARDAIHARYPNVRIVGCHQGHLSTPELVESALSDIEQSRPDLLLVGFGSPIQEEVIVEHRERLNVVPVIWPVGALTSHIAGLHPRAPKLMRKAGAEWLWRLILEPRRLWRRYILGNPIFMSRVLWFRFFGNRVAH